MNFSNPYPIPNQHQHQHHPSFHPNYGHPNPHMYPSLMGASNTGSYSSLPQQSHHQMLQPSLSASSSLTNLSSASVQSPSSFTLPKIEFKPVEFGPIAEGCLSQLLVYIQISNADALLNSIDSNSSARLDIELPAFSHWTIEPVDVIDSDKSSGWSYKPRKSSVLLKKINKETLKVALEQTLSLVACDSVVSDEAATLTPGSNRLSIQPISRFHQFYVRLDTRNVSLYRDLLATQTLSESNTAEQFDPLLVQTQALVHLTVSAASSVAPPPPKRYSIDRIDIKV